MIQTAFLLPFAVQQPPQPFLSQKQPLALTVRCASSASEQDVGAVLRTVRLWTQFANTGGLAGSRINPAEAELHVSATSPPANPHCHFGLSECYVDDRAYVVLVEMLLRGPAASLIEAVELSRRFGEPLLSLTCGAKTSTYPATYAHHPFALTDQRPESGAYTVVLEMAQPLLDDNRNTLESALMIWTQVVLAGGFALAPNSPSDNYVEPDHQLTVFDLTVEWSMFKLQADPASIGALLNVLTCFSLSRQRISSVTIQ